MSRDTTLPYKNLLLSASICAAAAHSYANDELSDFTEEDIFSDIPQVVSATHLSQKLTEAPASITIIDRNMIEASGALKISDLFRLVPGMQAYDVHTNKQGVTYHGMSNDFPNKLEVMINGRSVYLPLLATVAWETIGLSVHDIDYIEVVRGSNTPTHGSNAFLGAINIITRSPLKDPDSEIRATVGSLDTENYTFRHAGSNDLMQFAVTGGYQSNDGIDRFNDDGVNKYLNFTSSFTPTLSDNIDIELGMSDGYASRGDGNDSTAEEAEFVHRQHSSNHQLVRWNRILDENSDFTLTYYHNYLKLSSPKYSDDELQAILEAALVPDVFPAIPPFSGTLTNAANPLGLFKDSEHGRMDLHDLEALGTQRFSSDSKLAYGLGIRYQRAQSETLFASSDQWVDETRWRAFGNWEYHPHEDWILNTGAMFEHSNNTGSAFSPRLAANYLLDKNSALRAAYTHSHRMPSLLDTFGNGEIVYPLGLGPDIVSTANPEIKPEENKSFELGYLKIWPENSAQFDIRVFYEDISNAIDSYWVSDLDDPIDATSRYQNNNSNWINRGFEIQLKTELPLPWESNLVFNYGYNDPQGARDRGPERPSERNDDLSQRAPNHTLSVLFSTKPTENTLIGITQYYVNHTEWLEGFPSGGPDNNYSRTDLKLSKHFNLDVENGLELSLIVQNLFDKRYSEFYQYNDFDRRSYIQLRFSY